MQYPVLLAANGRKLANPTTIMIDAATNKKFKQQQVELAISPGGGGFIILKKMKRHAPSGERSISKAVTGVERLRRPNATAPNDFRRSAYPQSISVAKTTKRKARKTTRKPKARKPSDMTITIDGRTVTGDVNDLRALFGIKRI